MITPFSKDIDFRETDMVSPAELLNRSATMVGYVTCDNESDLEYRYSRGITKLGPDSMSQIGLYLPAMMPLIDPSNPEVTEVDIDTSFIINKDKSFEPNATIKIRNYLTATPLRDTNTHESPRQKGESVEIRFIDNNPNNIRYTNRHVNENSRTYDYYKIFVIDRLSTQEPLKEYQFVMDSKEQYIGLQTNDGRNEIDIYTLVLDGKNGNITLKDTKGQIIQLDTLNQSITLQNQSGTTVQVQSTNVTVKAEGVINLDGPIINISGNLNVEGNINARGDILAAGINSNHHVHPGL